jgi:hypothetical protein
MADKLGIVLGTSIALILSGCGDEKAGDQANVTSIEVPEGNYQSELLAMPEGQRNAVFIRAIRDANAPETCQGVESSSYRGETSGAPTWTARCNDGGEWTIVIGRDGMADVIEGSPTNQAQQ